MINLKPLNREWEVSWNCILKRVPTLNLFTSLQLMNDDWPTHNGWQITASFVSSVLVSAAKSREQTWGALRPNVCPFFFPKQGNEALMWVSKAPKGNFYNQLQPASPSSIKELVPPHAADLKLPKGGNDKGKGAKGDKRHCKYPENFYSVLLFFLFTGFSVSFPSNMHVTQGEGANHYESDWLEPSMPHNSVHVAASPFDFTERLSRCSPASQNHGGNINVKLVPSNACWPYLQKCTLASSRMKQTISVFRNPIHSPISHHFLEPVWVDCGPCIALILCLVVFS